MIATGGRHSPSALAGSSAAGFFSSPTAKLIGTKPIRIFVRSSGGSAMKARAAAEQAATRCASFHSDMPITPTGSLRCRGRSIGIA